jgi:hypothetical protein
VAGAVSACAGDCEAPAATAAPISATVKASLRFMIFPLRTKLND